MTYQGCPDYKGVLVFQVHLCLGYIVTILHGRKSAQGYDVLIQQVYFLSTPFFSLDPH